MVCSARRSDRDMLTRAFVLAFSILVLVVARAPSAYADDVSCPDGRTLDRALQICFISVTSSGSGGSGQPPPPDVVDQGGAVSACMNRAFGRNEPVPCESDGGWWSDATQCYVQLMDPQPPKSDSVWQGNSEGAIYTCRGSTPGAAAPFAAFWSASMPAGPAAPVDSAVVAQTIVEQMELRAISIGMVPEDRPGSMGVVGLPVWMWVDAPTEQTYGPMTRSASLGTVTVTATATVSKVWWEMGDGGAVTCLSAGTPFTDGHGGQSSPDCGYTYTEQGTYTVRATSFWSVDWTSSTGVSGSIPLQFTQSRIVQIGELQVVRK